MDLDVRRGLERLGRRWSPLGLALAIQRRYGELHGNQMASAVTLTAFLTLFPLVLVGIAVLGFVSVSSGDVPRRVVENLGLTGSAADTVTDAIGKAESSRRVASVVGVLGLLWTGLGFAETLEYAYNTAWQVQPRGLKDKLVSLAWLAGLAVLVSATFGATVAIEWLGGVAAPVLVVVAVALNASLFLWTSWLLPDRDVGLRPLLLPALAGGVALEVLKVVGTLLVPRLVANSSALYGTVGVVFALLAWLLLLGRLIVYVAVTEVVVWERGHGTQRTVIDLPAIPGSRPVATTRAGDREESRAPASRVSRRAARRGPSGPAPEAPRAGEEA